MTHPAPARSHLPYWITTGIFCATMLVSGLAHSLRVEFIAESMAALGYPVWVSSILGLGKLLGVAALLAPGRPLLKEWAYAGFTFNLLGAAASHVFAGDPFGETIRPLVVLALGAASYLLRPADRRIPSGTGDAGGGLTGRTPAAASQV